MYADNVVKNGNKYVHDNVVRANVYAHELVWSQMTTKVSTNES